MTFQSFSDGKTVLAAIRTTQLFEPVSLTNRENRGICLAPGFLNDHSGQFAWIPFDCVESFSCVLCTHRDDGREPLSAFIAILRKLYAEAVAFPL